MFKFLPEERFLTDFETDYHLLGSGGFGCVFKCKHKLDLQHYAVKVVKIQKKTEEKIIREARFLASVEHPNIVRYYQAWIEDGYVLAESEEDGETIETEEVKEEDDDDVNVESEEVKSEEEEEDAGVGTEGSLVPLLFIQMELCRGTLWDILDEKSLENSEWAWRWFIQIMEGLNHLHSLGIVHNDLSTKNVFFDKNNNAKIGDFGVAKELGSTICTEDSLGAELYCAPEKKKGVQINSKMDIFSAGVMLYEILRDFSTGSERLKDLQKIKKGEIPPLLQTGSEQEVLQKIREGELPNGGLLGIEVLVKNMVSLNPSERPPVSDVLARLPELEEGFHQVLSLSSDLE